MPLTNIEIADIFLQIGDMMDYLDENTFKIRSYWSAAESLRRVGQPLADLAARNELGHIRGVGEAIEGKTREILETGTCKVYEELKAEVPAGARQLLASSLLTPRIVRVVVRTLGVTGPADLWKCIESRDLESVKELNQNDRAHVLRAALALRKSTSD